MTLTSHHTADLAPDTPAASGPVAGAASPPPLIEATRLALRGSRGVVYDDVSLRVPAGELVALIGPQGSGRTALLLTLAGRMAPTGGQLTVLHHRLPYGRRDVQHHSALVNLHHIDTLDDALTVGEVVRERAGLAVPLWRRPLGLADPRMGELTALAYGPGAAPGWDTAIWQLCPLQELQTKLLLGLIGNPQLMVVDDVDVVREPQEQARAWQTLAAVAAAGTAVVAAATHAGGVPDGVPIVATRRPTQAGTPRTADSSTGSPTGEGFPCASID